MAVESDERHLLEDIHNEALAQNNEFYPLHHRTSYMYSLEEAQGEAQKQHIPHLLALQKHPSIAEVEAAVVLVYQLHCIQKAWHQNDQVLAEEYWNMALALTCCLAQPLEEMGLSVDLVDRKGIHLSSMGASSGVA